MTDKKHSPIPTTDDEYVRIMQKLQTKHNKLFEKIVFAQREDKGDVAQSCACEISQVRTMMDMKKHEYLKLKWEMYQ